MSVTYHNIKVFILQVASCGSVCIYILDKVCYSSKAEPKSVAYTIKILVMLYVTDIE